MGLVKKENRKLYNGIHKELSLASWAQQQGYVLKFSHAATGHSVEFPGTVTSFSDSHASELKMTAPLWKKHAITNKALIY